ncbi:hypothetical protein D3C73_1268240 [compost metagenome]
MGGKGNKVEIILFGNVLIGPVKHGNDSFCPTPLLVGGNDIVHAAAFFAWQFICDASPRLFGMNGRFFTVIKPLIEVF